MAQTGYSKVQIYSSSTATNTPSAGNLTNDTNGSELAINITDGKLFYKDNGGVVQVLASKAGNVNVASFSAGTTGFTPSSATSGAVTLAGTLATTNGGTGLTSFTANGVVYASSTSALAGSANMVFDGSTLTTLNSAYTGTLTGGTGIVNLGSGQFYKDASGNVGIGTSSPQSKFNVYGSAGTANITMSDSTLGVSYGGQVRGYGVGGIGGVAELGVLDNGTYTKGFYVASQALYVSFYTGSASGASSERMRITSNGQIAMGTATTSAGKLTIPTPVASPLQLSSGNAGLTALNTSTFTTIGTSIAGSGAIVLVRDSSLGGQALLLIDQYGPTKIVTISNTTASGFTFQLSGGDLQAKATSGTPNALITFSAGN